MKRECECTSYTLSFAYSLTMKLKLIIGPDQIIAFGAGDYPPTVAEFEADKPVARPILGGTGKYIDARGQLISTRNKDGSYTQVFTLLK